MVVYKITVDDFEYIGSTSRSIVKRIGEHNYKLSEPLDPVHNSKSYSRLYRKLRECGVTKIEQQHYEILDQDLTGKDMLRKEQEEIEAVPKDKLLNSHLIPVNNLGY